MFIRCISMMIPPSAAMAPPLSPVPDPRGRNGMEYSLASFDDFGNLLCVLRENDGVRLVLEQGQRVALVDEQFGLVGNDTVPCP